MTLSSNRENLVQTLPERIADTLSLRIMQGRYQPGERLIEAGLSKEFSVSHGPIRASLSILQSRGLVAISSYRGARVEELSVREVTDLYEVRAALVSLRARWIAKNLDRQEILRTVKHRIQNLGRIAEMNGAKEDFFLESFEINQLLTDALPNRWLRSTLQAINLQTGRYSRLALTTSVSRRQVATLWKSLLNAMSDGDASKAMKIAASLALTTRDAAIKHIVSEKNKSSNESNLDQRQSRKPRRKPVVEKASQRRRLIRSKSKRRA